MKAEKGQLHPWGSEARIRTTSVETPDQEEEFLLTALPKRDVGLGFQVRHDGIGTSGIYKSKRAINPRD